MERDFAKSSDRIRSLIARINEQESKLRNKFFAGAFSAQDEKKMRTAIVYLARAAVTLENKK